MFNPKKNEIGCISCIVVTYNLNNGNCKEILNCYNSKNSICDSCYDGFYYKDNNYLSLLLNCFLSENNIGCINCSGNYYLKNNSCFKISWKL